MGGYGGDDRSKPTSAAEAVAHLPREARIAMPLGVGQPPALLAALADRALAEPVAMSLHYLLSTPAAATVLRTGLRERIRPLSMFHGKIERMLDAEAHAAGLPPIDFVPTAFSQTPRVLIEQARVDTLIATVSPMDEDGWFSLGTNTDYALPVSRAAQHVLLEINPQMPRVHGEGRIHISAATALVEHEAPLCEVPQTALKPDDETIGAIIAGLIDDGDTLQIGIGAVPDAVCAALRDHRRLGIHTELMTSGLAKLMAAGVIDNRAKSLHPGKSVFAFALGDRTLYDFLDDNPMMESRPVDYTNDPAVIARNDRMVSVNATLQIDLSGACNSESMGGRQFSASGGQLDFVRGAYAARGGRSIIACHSTAASGRVSRIVPALEGAVTTPRNDTHIIVTEYGRADLKGKTLDERARALIGLAHPTFRESLERDWRRLRAGG